MSLIDQLIEQVADESISLSSLLLKTKAVAWRLKSTKLKKWADAELRGYQLGIVVPDYRIVFPRSKGTFRTQQGLVYNIPKAVYLDLLPQEIQEDVTRCEVRESAERLERFTADEARHWYNSPWPAHFVEQYGTTGIGKEGNRVLIEAHWLITKELIRDVLHLVRVGLQELLIEIGSKHPDLVQGKSDISLGLIREVDTLVGQVIYEGCTFIGRDQSMSNKNIRAGRDISVGGDFVVADVIENSFNKVAGSSAPDPVKELLQQLGDAVKAMAKDLPEKQARDVAEEYERLAEEAAKPEPKKSWVKTALEGLRDVAVTVAAGGSAVLDLIEKARQVFNL